MTDLLLFFFKTKTTIIYLNMETASNIKQNVWLVNYVLISVINTAI